MFIYLIIKKNGCGASLFWKAAKRDQLELLPRTYERSTFNLNGVGKKKEDYHKILSNSFERRGFFYEVEACGIVYLFMCFIFNFIIQIIE